MTQELEATASPARDKLLTTELVPEQVLPKVMTTFGLTATYVFIICWITGSSIMAAGGWTAIPMWVLGILTFLVPAGMAVAELGNLWPGEGGVYIWATRTMGETWGFIGGYLSWIPVVLNSASSPAIILQFLLLGVPRRTRLDADHHPATGHPVGRHRPGAGKTRRQPADHERRLRRLLGTDRRHLHLGRGLRVESRFGPAVQRARRTGARLRRCRFPVRHRAAVPASVSRRRTTWVRSSCRCAGADRR